MIGKKSKPKTVAVNPNVADDLDGLRTDKQAAFSREYPKDFCATQAAIRAGYSEATAYSIGSELLKKPEVRAAIERRMAAAADAAMVDATLVVSELYQLAMADSRELMSVETDSCRHCYGIDHRCQYTPGEYERALTDTMKVGAPAPEMLGGIGFDPRRPPVESCPECFGRGVERVTITPSRKLSRAATRLLASMKATKDGVEIKVHDQFAALTVLGKITGVIRDRQELTGAGGGPIALTAVPNFAAMTDDQLREVLRRSGGHPLLEGHTTTKHLTEGEPPQ
jgi:hypothetical protein